MKYEKPEVVAKSEAKDSFVAGCPTETVQFPECHHWNEKCLCGQIN